MTEKTWVVCDSATFKVDYIDMREGLLSIWRKREAPQGLDFLVKAFAPGCWKTIAEVG